VTKAHANALGDSLPVVSGHGTDTLAPDRRGTAGFEPMLRKGFLAVEFGRDRQNQQGFAGSRRPTPPRVNAPTTRRTG
jgi:hypothetical protein